MKITQNFTVNYHYEVLFTRGLFAPANPLLRDLLRKETNNKSIKLGVVIDTGLLDYQPDLIDKIKNYIANAPELTLVETPLIVLGGEPVKNETNELIKTLEFINNAKIDRHSFLIAIGGGAVLDMVGFAAAIGHRGIRHIRIPTTVLSQNDSGVGVKNSINFFDKKNFLGSFAPPYAVINDFEFLNTLTERDWRSGMSEAVKVALIKDAHFFNWIETNALALNQRDIVAMEKLIFDCAALHVAHISTNGDPFEMGSSRPLDFGHWAAHKLEQLTQFEVKHGEAVAIGLALDLAYAVQSKFIDLVTFDRIYQVLINLGFDLFHPLLLDAEGTSINPELIKGLEEFREHLGGVLTITMIEQIGAKFDVHSINIEQLNLAAIQLSQKKKLHAN
ncbi:MAG: 3-dehydroquinate synthase [Flammeovirgaceae bacterium]|jgi:3-dehydroquinate synthase|nr:3-dehydroquinate synthase [Flammeovirgaceae bacterium]|tara:strand:- start:9538 stop:10707 length:1170 start_codon:yes stop_codon:yes gene_type:complete